MSKNNAARRAFAQWIKEMGLGRFYRRNVFRTKYGKVVAVGATADGNPRQWPDKADFYWDLATGKIYSKNNITTKFRKTATDRQGNILYKYGENFIVNKSKYRLNLPGLTLAQMERMYDLGESHGLFT